MIIPESWIIITSPQLQPPDLEHRHQSSFYLEPKIQQTKQHPLTFRFTSAESSVTPFPSFKKRAAQKHTVLFLLISLCIEIALTDWLANEWHIVIIIIINNTFSSFFPLSRTCICDWWRTKYVPCISCYRSFICIKSKKNVHTQHQQITAD